MLVTAMSRWRSLLLARETSQASSSLPPPAGTVPVELSRAFVSMPVGSSDSSQACSPVWKKRKMSLVCDPSWPCGVSRDEDATGWEKVNHRVGKGLSSSFLSLFVALCFPTASQGTFHLCCLDSSIFGVSISSFARLSSHSPLCSLSFLCLCR